MGAGSSDNDAHDHAAGRLEPRASTAPSRSKSYARRSQAGLRTPALSCLQPRASTALMGHRGAASGKDAEAPYQTWDGPISELATTLLRLDLTEVRRRQAEEQAAKAYTPWYIDVGMSFPAPRTTSPNVSPAGPAPVAALEGDMPSIQAAGLPKPDNTVRQLKSSSRQQQQRASSRGQSWVRQQLQSARESGPAGAAARITPLFLQPALLPVETHDECWLATSRRCPIPSAPLSRAEATRRYGPLSPKPQTARTWQPPTTSQQARHNAQRPATCIGIRTAEPGSGSGPRTAARQPPGQASQRLTQPESGKHRTPGPVVTATSAAAETALLRKWATGFQTVPQADAARPPMAAKTLWLADHLLQRVEAHAAGAPMPELSSSDNTSRSSSCSGAGADMSQGVTGKLPQSRERWQAPATTRRGTASPEPPARGAVGHGQEPSSCGMASSPVIPDAESTAPAQHSALADDVYQSAQPLDQNQANPSANANLRAAPRGRLASCVLQLPAGVAGPQNLADWRDAALSWLASPEGEAVMQGTLQHGNARRPPPTLQKARPTLQPRASRQAVDKAGPSGKRWPTEVRSTGTPAGHPLSAGLLQEADAGGAHRRAALLWAKLRALGPRRLVGLTHQAALQHAGAQGVTASVAYLQAHALTQFKQAGALAQAARARAQRMSRLQEQHATPTPGLQAQHQVVGDHADDHDVKPESGPGALSLASCAQAMKRRLRAQVYALIAANPAAFKVDTAARADIALDAAVEKLHGHGIEAPHAAAATQADTLAAGPATAPIAAAMQDAVLDLQAQRPFFRGLQPQRERVVRQVREAPLEVPPTPPEGDPPAPPPWTLEDSIFWKRRGYCEARSVYDTDKVKAAQFNIDWEHIASKARFRKVVTRDDRAGVNVKASGGGPGQDVAGELEAVRRELEAHRDVLRSCFIYASMASGGSAAASTTLTMNLSQWMAFCKDTNIMTTGAGQRGATPGEMQTVFVAVNYEDESDTEESAANDDSAMMRFEFLEALIRVAVSKYVVTKKLENASVAVHTLLREEVLPSLPELAHVDPNTFRQDRLYNQEMDAAVQEYYDFIAVLHKYFRAKERAKHFTVEHFVTLLEAAGLIGAHTGVEYREVKLIFCWSQMLVADELLNRKKQVSLTLFDLIEALARVADLISPPESEDIETWFAAQADGRAGGADGGGTPSGAPAKAMSPLPSGASMSGVAMPSRDGRNSSSPTPRAGTLPQGKPQAGRSTAMGTNRLAAYWETSSEVPRPRRASSELLAPPTRPLVVKFRAVMEVILHRMLLLYGGTDMASVTARMKKAAAAMSGGAELG